MLKILLVFQIDALRHDYVNNSNTPFLNSLIKTSKSGTVIPSFGFEPDAAYLAGLTPEESSTGAQFYYDLENSPFKVFKFLPTIIDKLPEIVSKIIRKILAKSINIINSTQVLSIANIPFHILHFFNQTFKTRVDSNKYLEGHKTIFHFLKESNLTYFAHSLPSKVDIDSVINRVETNFFKETYSFSFILIGNLDVAGHKYGPESKELKNELKKVDFGIQKIYEQIGEKYDAVDLLIFGDHGMVEVSDKVDLLSELNDSPFTLGKDFILFLDSTMARFWFANDSAKRFILQLLSGKKYGKILSDNERIHYSLNFTDNRFGDLIFILNPGFIFLPNFYQKNNIVKGMHGYLPEIKDQQAFFLMNLQSIPFESQKNMTIDMKSLFPTMLKILSIENTAEKKYIGSIF